MKKKLTFTTSCFFILTTGMFSQVRGESYVTPYCFRTTNGHTLVFGRDSIAALQFPPDAVGETFEMGINYAEADSTVTFYPRYPDKTVTSVYKKVKDGLLSYKDSVIYVSSRVPHNRIYISDNRVYYDKVPGGRSIMQLRDRREMDPNLTKLLDEVAKYPERYEVKKYQGFDADEKFGIDGAFGVTVIARKKE